MAHSREKHAWCPLLVLARWRWGLVCKKKKKQSFICLCTQPSCPWLFHHLHWSAQKLCYNAIFLTFAIYIYIYVYIKHFLSSLAFGVKRATFYPVIISFIALQQLIVAVTLTLRRVRKLESLESLDVGLRLAKSTRLDQTSYDSPPPLSLAVPAYHWPLNTQLSLNWWILFFLAGSPTCGTFLVPFSLSFLPPLKKEVIVISDIYSLDSSWGAH